MTVLRTFAELRQWRSRQSTVAFVPTMGALHEGHLSLIDEARKHSNSVIVSIYVNPLQFDDPADLNRYPRVEDVDVRLCEERGASAVFLPMAEEMESPIPVFVTVDKVTEKFEGDIRPGHFRGVATVVARLFSLVQPNYAIFGLKDLQQCAVISNLIRGLCFPIELVLVETLREPDGLARSSRNKFLTSEQRAIAPMIKAQLDNIKSEVEALSYSVDALEPALTKASASLKALGFDVNYLSCVDPNTFQFPLEIRGSRVIVAAKLGSVRLLDNIEL